MRITIRLLLRVYATGMWAISAPKIPEAKLILMCLSCTHALVSAIKLNIITVYTGQNPMYGYIATGPAYIAALERARVMYPEVYLNSTLYTVYYPGGLIICADGAVQMTFIAGNITDILERVSGFNVIYTAGASYFGRFSNLSMSLVHVLCIL